MPKCHLKLGVNLHKSVISQITPKLGAILNSRVPNLREAHFHQKCIKNECFFGDIGLFFVFLLAEMPIDMKQGKWILLLLSLLTTLVTWAQPITEQEAAERALQFIRKHNTSSRARAMIRATSPKILEAVKVDAEKI